MKKKYQYIYFREANDYESRSVSKSYDCINIKKGHKLGHVRWNPGWRQYCYYPVAQATYSSGCLNDIAHFISQLS